MNKISYKPIYCLLLFCMAAVCILPACKKDKGGAPVITGVRNYAAAPGDSVVGSLIPGQWVVLLGHNLGNALRITFNGVEADFNAGLFSDTSAVVEVPSVIPFPSVPAEELNTIRYYTPEGSTVFTFNIAAPAPTILSISNENALEGDSVYVYGLNFFFIEEVSFAGTPITAYAGADDGTTLRFVLPALTQSGPLVITTKSGTATTPFNVNDVTTGALCNFDDVNTFSWGTGTSNSSANYPGNRGNYAVLNTGALPSGEGSWWNWERGINTNGVQWIPVDSLGVPPDEYALKFEISVPAAWNGIGIYVIKGYNWDYMYRYEPWLDANGNAFSFTTAGWRTVTMPFSEFRKDEGKGSPPSDLTTLLGASASGEVNIHTKNFTNTTSPMGLTAAIDNIRVVKIK